MNKRIKELVQQTDAWCDQNLPANWTDDVDQHLPLWNAKFAELIVLDFVNIVNATRPAVGGVPAELALDWVERNVKAYFGVEE